MEGAPTTSADGMLASLSQTYQESIDKENSVDTAEEVEDGDEKRGQQRQQQHQQEQQEECFVMFLGASFTYAANP